MQNQNFLPLLTVQWSTEGWQ